MACPFPGMDPFLEHHEVWPVFHAWFIRKLAEQAIPRAEVLNCFVDVERTVYSQDEEGETVLIGAPDQLVGETGDVPSWDRNGPGGTAVAIAAPLAIHEVVLHPEVEERVWQDSILIRPRNDPRRVLAVVELLSPTNKGGSHMPKYRTKRYHWLTSSAHFMEIDFLRGGENPSRQLFPELPPTPYFIFVARKTELGRKEESYPLRLQDSLPAIALPLGPPRPDLPLDLAAAFQSAHALTVQHRVNYEREPIPPPPLSPEDLGWVIKLLGRKE